MLELELKKFDSWCIYEVPSNQVEQSCGQAATSPAWAEVHQGAPPSMCCFTCMHVRFRSIPEPDPTSTPHYLITTQLFGPHLEFVPLVMQFAPKSTPAEKRDLVCRMRAFPVQVGSGIFTHSSTMIDFSANSSPNSNFGSSDDENRD